MPSHSLQDVQVTKIIGTQRGFKHDDSFDTEINRFLELGWIIVDTYKEPHGQFSNELVVLLGWVKKEHPIYPPGQNA